MCSRRWRQKGLVRGMGRLAGCSLTGPPLPVVPEPRLMISASEPSKPFDGAKRFLLSSSSEALNWWRGFWVIVEPSSFVILVSNNVSENVVQIVSLCQSIYEKDQRSFSVKCKWLRHEYSRMKIRLYREKEDIQIKRPLDILSQCQCLGDDGEREIYDRAEWKWYLWWEAQVPADPVTW